MTTDDAKTYLAGRQIPGLFESLMTGLMYHRPQDHIQYLIDCLQKIQEKGGKNVSWHAFVDLRRKQTPLPPITPPDGKRGTSRPGSKQMSREPSKVDDRPKSIEEKRGSPLPPISSTDDKSTPMVQKEASTLGTQAASIPDVPVVLVMGGPGSGKKEQMKRLADKDSTWTCISMGALLKEEAERKRSAEERWEMIFDLIQKRQLVPEDIVTNLLVEKLKSHPKAKGFLIEGFPKTSSQVEQFDKHINRLDVGLMLDCDESFCTQRLLKRYKDDGNEDENTTLITRRLNSYKENTLPAAKLLDDRGKLVVINSEKDVEAVATEVSGVIGKALSGESSSAPKTNDKIEDAADLPPPVAYSRPFEDEKSQEEDTDEKRLAEILSKLKDAVLFRGPPEIENKDTGRKEGFPTCPIIVIAGGPGSGKSTQAEKLVNHFKGSVHLSMGDIIRKEISDKGTADDKWSMISTLVTQGEMAPEEVTVDLLKENIMKQKDASAIFLDGYPRDKQQLEDFNKHVGGLNFAVLFDCEEFYMTQRLLDRGKDTGRVDDNIKAIANRINFYRTNTLPIYKYLDDQGKLVVLFGDRDEAEIFFDVTTLLNKAFFGKDSGTQDAGVVEEEFVKETATVTGQDEGNSEYSKQLDELPQTKQQEKTAESIDNPNKPLIDPSEIIPNDSTETTQEKSETSQETAEQTQETAQTSQSTEEPSKETGQTSQETAEPIQEPAQTSQETTELTQEAPKTSQDTTELTQEPAQTSQETAEPKQEPAQTSQETTEPTQEPAQTSQETAYPKQEPAQTSQETTEPTEEPAQTSQETAEPAQEPAQTSQETAEPTQEPAQTSQETAEPQQEPSQTSQETTEPVQEPAQTSQETAEPTQETENTSKVMEEPSAENAG